MDTELIALQHPNRRAAERLVQLWGEGKAVLPIDPGLAPPMVEQLLEAFRPSRFEDASGVTYLPDGVPVDEEIALVVPTSGTSGPPKGVELSHAALRWSARAVNARLGAGRWLSCVPVSHIAGIGILVRSLEAGTEPVIHNRFDIGSIYSARGTNLISLVPTTLQRLLGAGVDLSQYSTVLVGGAAAPPGLIQQARDAGVPVVCTYGMTETCGGCVYDGEPLSGVAARIVGGQIELKGPMLMQGYRLAPEQADRAFDGNWFRTTDLGDVDDHCKLQVFGRADDVIVTGGEKVSASVVEDLLRRDKRVADAAVVGLDSLEWGQIVAALIVPSGRDVPTLEELRAVVKTHSAAHMAPRIVVTTDRIPRTPSGKVRRGRVVEMLTDATSDV